MNELSKVKRNVRALYVVSALVSLVGLFSGIGYCLALSKWTHISEEALGDLRGTCRTSITYTLILIGILVQVRTLWQRTGTET